MLSHFVYIIKFNLGLEVIDVNVNKFTILIFLNNRQCGVIHAKCK